MNNIAQSKPEDVMTFRDYIAIHAMQGLLVSDECGTWERVSQQAYTMADAMLKARGDQVISFPTHCAHNVPIDRECRACDKANLAGTKTVTHGVNCYKEPHVGVGHLHDSDDDRPYDVDGLSYCGRCHQAL